MLVCSMLKLEASVTKPVKKASQTESKWFTRHTISYIIFLVFFLWMLQAG